MATVSVNDMRIAISRVYDNPTWEEKVKKMADDQVTAIYLSFCRNGKFDKRPTPPPKKTVKSVPDITAGCSDTKVIFEGQVYPVCDITEHSYVVADKDESPWSNSWMEIPKNLCEVI